MGFDGNLAGAGVNVVLVLERNGLLSSLLREHRMRQEERS